jgi:cystathionine beta-lyase
VGNDFSAEINDASADSSFDAVIDRENSNSMKWAIGEKLLAADEFEARPLPMWVADMDFPSPRPVIDALHEAVEHGAFGYPGGATDSYINAVVGWQARRFGWEVAKEWVVQTSGIITTLKMTVQAFSAPGDTALIQPPVYAHFHNEVLMNGRHLT